jgi:hypothetical protein
MEPSRAGVRNGVSFPAARCSAWTRWRRPDSEDKKVPRPIPVAQPGVVLGFPPSPALALATGIRNTIDLRPFQPPVEWFGAHTPKRQRIPSRNCHRSPKKNALMDNFGPRYATLNCHRTLRHRLIWINGSDREAAYYFIS